MGSQKGKGEEKIRSRPAIIVTAPSILSLRSHGMRKGPSTRTKGSITSKDLGDPSDGQDDASVATSLLCSRDQSEKQAKHHIERLPRALRVGQQSAKFQHRSTY